LSYVRCSREGTGNPSIRPLGLWFDADLVLHSESKLLLAAEVMFGCLDGHVTEQKLDLVDLAAAGARCRCSKWIRYRRTTVQLKTSRGSGQYQSTNSLIALIIRSLPAFRNQAVQNGRLRLFEIGQSETSLRWSPLSAVLGHSGRPPAPPSVRMRTYSTLCHQPGQRITITS
jgi:hypothetical protein